MDIDSKETLHQVLDEMIKRHGGCNRYRKYDDDLYWWGEYKELRITFYPEWFADGKIVIH